jgi:hypothetical protein
MNVKRKDEKFTNLAGAISKADKAKTVFQCIDCGSDLIKDLTFRLKNPHAGGIGYFCGPCNKTFDDALVRLPKKPKAVISSVGDPNLRNIFMIATVPENKGLAEEFDEYSKYDPEKTADQQIINSGATIINSEITLSDSSGSNRTLVRRRK